MARNHLLSEGPLLNESGDLAEAGYATSLVKEYSRSSIAAKKWRIKEWDYYYVGNAHHGVALTVADNGYMSMASASILDFDKKSDVTESRIGWFPLGKLGLPSTSEKGDILFKGKGFDFAFRFEGATRRLTCHMDSFGKKKEVFHCDIYLEKTNEDSLVIATPFKKAKHFYYNQKINCLRAQGYAKVGEKVYDLNQDTYGVLDWGRGVWTYRNTWYWSSMSSIYQGHVIGFNLGYGFGDTSKASENILYLDGKSYKLDDVYMEIPLTKKGEDYLAPWRFHCPSKEVDLIFTPVLDRHADTNALLIRSNQHQVFGFFSGNLVFDGKAMTIAGVPGFAEKVYNRW